MHLSICQKKTFATYDCNSHNAETSLWGWLRFYMWNVIKPKNNTWRVNLQIGKVGDPLWKPYLYEKVTSMKIIITIRVLFSTAVTVHVPLACSNILIRRRAKKMSTEKGLRVNFIFPSLSRLACLGLLVILRWLVGSFNKNTKYGSA